MSKDKVSIFWFRRDLRLQDNHGLYEALKGESKVLPIFIFDKNILDDLEDKKDARVSFIHEELSKMNEELKNKGSRLHTFYSTPQEVFNKLIDYYEIQTVFANEDYEPYAIDRDEKVKSLLIEKGIALKLYKDQVVFSPKEVLKDDGSPYLVYTPYSKKWLDKLTNEDLEGYSSALRFDNWYTADFKKIFSLNEMGFQVSEIKIPSASVTDYTLNVYHEERDYPAKDITSRIGVHLRFGTVSIREVASLAKGKSEVFLKELIWREFFMTILYYHPKVVDNNFNEKYDSIKWRNSEEDFEKWKKGETGFPLVDAGMRELNETGFMHNRVRMLVASFLCKHLLIDWKWGEAYFAEKLLDYDLAANNGNWQWAAGTGVDAAPYFRVFNPTTQIKKFDKELKYIRKWVKDYDELSYPAPMVEHKQARQRALDTYKQALAN